MGDGAARSTRASARWLAASRFCSSRDLRLARSAAEAAPSCRTKASGDTNEGVDGVFDQASFSGIQLLTAPGRVMTPRPATERLVERAFARLGSEPATVADVGSGSCAIAIAIALRAPNSEVWAAD